MNKTAKTKNIQSNRHEILLGMQQNTTKPSPHILVRGKEKPVRLCHKTPPNLAPHNYAIKIFETNKKIHKIKINSEMEP